MEIKPYECKDIHVEIMKIEVGLCAAVVIEFFELVNAVTLDMMDDKEEGVIMLPHALVYMVIFAAFDIMVEFIDKAVGLLDEFFNHAIEAYATAPILRYNQYYIDISLTRLNLKHFNT